MLSYSFCLTGWCCKPQGCQGSKTIDGLRPASLCSTSQHYEGREEGSRSVPSVFLYLTSKVCDVFRNRALIPSSWERTFYSLGWPWTHLWRWGWLRTLDWPASVSQGTHHHTQLLFFNVHISVYELWMSMHLLILWKPKEGIVPLNAVNLELQAVARPLWVLRAKHGFSARAASTFIAKLLSQSLPHSFLNVSFCYILNITLSK